MSLSRRVVTIFLGVAALVAAAVAVTYLVVACQSLPGLLGPVPGDTHPRTRLGAAVLLLAVLLGIGVVLSARPRQTRQ